MRLDLHTMYGFGPGASRRTDVVRVRAAFRAGWVQAPISQPREADT